MGRRSDRAERIAATLHPTSAREGLELRRRGRLVEEPRLATMVTATGAAKEPLHRWIPYTQGFSPGLVRLFLSENAGLRRRGAVVLDPFCGSGTTVVECARQGVRAVGVEALASMVFLASSRWFGPMVPMPPVQVTVDWHVLADSLAHPLHRASLMLAVGRQYTSSGRRNRGAKLVSELVPKVAAMISEDLTYSLSTEGMIVQGDARDLAMIADGSISGIVTSPPYLSRYDYRETTSPYEEVYRHWYSTAGLKSRQLQASPTTTANRQRDTLQQEIPALTEITTCLAVESGEKVSKMAAGYFADMTQVLRECHRVLAPGGIVWMVIGGARIKDVYVPSDLMVAEVAERAGFEIAALRVARDLVLPRRKFGRIGQLSPRETVVVMVKP